MSPEQIAENKRAMLRAMLAGVPTKESEGIKKLQNFTEGNVHNDRPITESVERELPNITSNLPSATELNRVQLGQPKEVPLDAISALLSGNKEKAKQIAESEREIPAEKFQTRQVILDRAKKLPLKENKLPKSNLIANGNEETIEEVSGININELSKIINELVKKEVNSYLSEVFELEEKRRQLKENIVIKIGETLFSGQLKPIPKKPKNR